MKPSPQFAHFLSGRFRIWTESVKVVTTVPLVHFCKAYRRADRRCAGAAWSWSHDTGPTDRMST